ncbi:MAG: AAA family ATPase, partial [Planctomycetota bacterium]
HMAEISRSDLFAKLSPLCFKSLESATMLCKLREHSYVDLAHWIFQILQLQDSDLHRIFRKFNINAARLASDITERLEAYSRSGEGLTDLSPDLEQSVERAWLYASLLFHSKSIRSGHWLVGLLKTSELKQSLFKLSSEFGKIDLNELTENFTSNTEGSPESESAEASGEGISAESTRSAPAAMGGTAALAKYATDLTLAAQEGRLDPVVGRDAEVRQVINILLRRRQNNPILTGEAGVGKTAVVEGLALRVATGLVPPALDGMQLLALDVGRLQAGASMKGEFEQRLKQVIDEVQASTRPTILFIDEAHTLLGAGDKANASGDAANLLKPALARGTLRTIAATTWSEYKRYIEKDPALTRRFQVVKVEQPSIDSAVRMLRHLTAALEKHHAVRILDEAVYAAVELSSRYVPDRQLPDKAVSLLDTACARVAISQHALPARVEDCQKSIESLDVEASIIRRESLTDTARRTNLEQLEQNRSALESELIELETRWKQEKALVTELLTIQRELQDARGESSQTVAHPGVRSGSEIVSQNDLDQSIRNGSAGTVGAAGQSAASNLSLHDSSPITGSHASESLVQETVDYSTQIDTLHPSTGAGNSDVVRSVSDSTPESPSSQKVAQVGAEGSGSPSPGDQSNAIAEMQARLAELQGELSGVQGESPLV